MAKKKSASGKTLQKVMKETEKARKAAVAYYGGHKLSDFGLETQSDFARVNRAASEAVEVAAEDGIELDGFAVWSVIKDLQRAAREEEKEHWDSFYPNGCDSEPLENGAHWKKLSQQRANIMFGLARTDFDQELPFDERFEYFLDRLGPVAAAAYIKARRALSVSEDDYDMARRIYFAHIRDRR